MTLNTIFSVPRLPSLKLKESPHALITPNFLSGSRREIVGDNVQNLDVGLPLFTLLQPEMPTDGV